MSNIPFLEAASFGLRGSNGVFRGSGVLRDRRQGSSGVAKGSRTRTRQINLLFEPKFESGRGFEEQTGWFPVDLLFSSTFLVVGVLSKREGGGSGNTRQVNDRHDWLYVGVAPFRAESAPVPRQWGGGGHIKQHSVCNDLPFHPKYTSIRVAQ